MKKFLSESGKKSSNQAVKNLLENYGFELVMQFNEYHQRKKEEEERRRKAEEMVAEANNANVTASTTASEASNNANMTAAVPDTFSFEAKNEGNEATSNGECSNNDTNEIGKGFLIFINVFDLGMKRIFNSNSF